MDILVDVRVQGVSPVGRVGQPAEDFSLLLEGEAFGLGLGYLGKVAVDGGLGGGEGNALDDGDGLHGVFLLVCSLSLILL